MDREFVAISSLPRQGTTGRDLSFLKTAAVIKSYDN